MGRTSPETAGPHRTGRRFFRPCRVWLPTPLTLVMCAALAALSAHPLLHRIYSSLAVNAPEGASILVVEGWIPDASLSLARDWLESGQCELLVTVGAPLEIGAPLIAYENFAEFAAKRLVMLGVAPQHICVVASPSSRVERTYNAALSVREWLDAEGRRPEAVDVLTHSVHARRSRLSYSRVLEGRGIRVGVVSAPSVGYEPSRWWTTSSGFRAVVSEVIACTYTTLLTRAPEALPEPPPPPRCGAWERGRAPERQRGEVEGGLTFRLREGGTLWFARAVVAPGPGARVSGGPWSVGDSLR